MNKSNFPPYPMPPRQSSSSQLSGSLPTQIQSDTGAGGANRDSETVYGDHTHYFTGLHNAIVPRVQEFEKKQVELAQIIDKERKLEELVRKIVYMNTINCIAVPVCIILIITFFFWCQSPAESVAFYKNYLKTATVSGLVAFVAFIRPLWLMHGYSKRIDLIEKKLKLNGND